MTIGDPRKLKKLIALQKLGTARLEAELAAGNARRHMLDEERDALMAMQDTRYEGAVYVADSALVTRRLAAIAAGSRALEHKLEADRKALLGEQRRVGFLENRLDRLRDEAERRELVGMIDEFLGRQMPKDRDDCC